MDLASWESEKNSENFKFFSAVEQNIDVFNMGTHEIDISINGDTKTCTPGDHNIIQLGITSDPTRKEFFATDFLNEPEVEYPAKR